MWPTLSLLQASLLLQRQTRSLESLERKIRTRFGKVLSIRGEQVYIDPRVDQYIRSVESYSPPASGSIRDLDCAIVSGSQATRKQSHADQLMVSTIEGKYTMVKRCLQALNEDDPAVREKVQPVLDYAVDWLPEHIHELRDENILQLESERCKLVGQGLVGFLSDEECIDLAWTEKPLLAGTWVGDMSNVAALGQLLKNKTIVQGMSPKNRRIARKTTQQLPGRPAPFLELLAIRAAWHWLQQDSKAKREEIDDDDKSYYRIFCCYRFVKEFLRMIRNPQSLALDFATTPNDGMQNVHSAALDHQEEIGGDAGDSTSSKTGKSDPSQVEEAASLLESEVHGSVAEKLENKDADASSIREPVAIELLSKEEVQKARDWAFEKLGLRENGVVLTRMAQVLLGEDDSAAVDYLQKASTFDSESSFDNSYTRIQTLATAYANQKKFVDAHAVLAPLVDRLRARCKQTSSTVLDRKRLATSTKTAAEYLVELQKDDQAIARLEECLEQVADNSCRQELVRLLCKNKQFSKAESAFDDWVTSSEGSVDQSPASFFTKAATDDRVGSSMLFFWTRGTSVHDRIVEILETAIAEARKYKRVRDLCFLLTIHGVAHAVVGEEERLQQALDSWTRSITHCLSADRAGPYICLESVDLVVRYEFDLAVKNLHAQPQTPLDIRQTTLERLKSVAKSYLTPMQDSYGSIVYSPMVYLAVYARLAGLTDEAKAILKPDMEKALEVLSNTDPEDDDMGIGPLQRIMLSLGDIVGASSFWSFYDRASLAAKKSSSRSKLVNGNSSKEGILDREITASCGADATMAVVNGTKDNDRSHNDTYVSDFRWTGGCNLCNSKVSLDSRMNMEIWSCTYCPNMDFCRECHEKVKSNQSEQLMCGSEHVHVLMKHFDYDDEEVKGQNVRIGWQLVESNGGRDRQRIGGKIVTLDEWVQILRKEWDIPESKTEGRLQK